MSPVPLPAKAILASRRISNRAVAASFSPGMSAHYVGRILNGFLPPSPRFRAGVAAMTGLAEETLFPLDPPADLDAAILAIVASAPTLSPVQTAILRAAGLRQTAVSDVA